MTAGDGIKHGAEGAKNVTDKVVDSVEQKIDEVATTVGGALGSATEAIRHAVGKDTPAEH